MTQRRIKLTNEPSTEEGLERQEQEEQDAGEPHQPLRGEARQEVQRVHRPGRRGQLRAQEQRHRPEVDAQAQDPIVGQHGHPGTDDQDLERHQDEVRCVKIPHNILMPFLVKSF